MVDSTGDTMLGAAREAVALYARLYEDSSPLFAPNDIADTERLYVLTRKHAHEWAKALLAAHEENQRLTAELTRAIADLRGTEDGSDNLIGQSLVWIGGDEWQDEFAEWYQPHQWPLGMHRAMNAFLAGKVRDYRTEVQRLREEEEKMATDQEIREDQLAEIYRALGGTREDEWVFKSPPDLPPDSGDAGADAIELAMQLMVEVAALRARLTPQTAEPEE